MEDYKKEQLANLIVECIKQDFEVKFLSQNLINTINVYQKEDETFVIEIPAVMYDLKVFKKKGVVIHNNYGSYASRIDSTGGFSGQHKDYINRSISKAIDLWMKENNFNGKVG